MQVLRCAERWGSERCVVPEPQELSAAQKKRNSSMNSLEFGKLAYDKGLSKLNKVLTRPGMYRVEMNACGEVLSVSRIKASAPHPNCFVFIVRKDRPPSFGSFVGLSDTQISVAEWLKKDCGRLLDAKQQAETAMETSDGGAAVEKRVAIHLQSLEERFGELPASRGELERARAEERRKEEAKKREEKERELLELERDLENFKDFGEVLEEERQREKRGGGDRVAKNESIGDCRRLGDYL